MVFPYQLAAIDLDGTLLGPDKTVSPANAAALNALRALGVQIVLASGRRYQNSARYRTQLALTGPTISCQGALILDPDAGEVFAEHFLDASVAREILRQGEEGGFSLIYYHRDHIFATRRDHWIELYESRVGEQVELIPELNALKGAGALKLVWYGDPQTLKNMRPDLEKKYRDGAGILPTDPENLEFMRAGIDKGASLRLIADRCGVPLARTLAFGDNENDVPMLRAAGLGVAMSVSQQMTRAAAGLVSPEGPPEDSFARAVDILIRQAQ